MARFSMYLPPFAPDYSGVCSALFDLNALTVIHDACGCTANYTGYDEPRWYGSDKAVYCSGLRESDAIFGNEDKFIARIALAAAEHKPEIIAFVGSPVPMVMGTDFTGFARELENRLEVPAFGFDTNGTEYYNSGAYAAGIALLERFADSAVERKPNSVNILGATPLDINSEDFKSLQKAIADTGLEINASFFTGLTLEQVRGAGRASVNLAISQTGVRLARYMERRFGIPYVVGFPAGELVITDWVSAIRAAETEKRNVTLEVKQSDDASILVIGDEVFAQSVKYALTKCGKCADAATLFGAETALYADTLDFADEQTILDALNSGKYNTLIADPLICQIAPENMRCIAVAQYSVSSKVCPITSKKYVGTNELIQEAL